MKTCSENEVVHNPAVPRRLSETAPAVQELARKACRLFGENPAHPGLSFKKVADWNGVYSVRVGRGYRALGKMDGQDIIWFWIGPHGAYDKQI